MRATEFAVSSRMHDDGRGRYDGAALRRQSQVVIATMRFSADDRRAMQRACMGLCDVLDSCPGDTLPARWTDFEQRIWPRWVAGEGRMPGNYWTWGVRALVTGGLVRPGWDLIAAVRISQ